VELNGHIKHTPDNYFQRFKDDELVGKGAVVVFLLRAGIRDRAALKTMTDAEQRKALIDENIEHTGRPRPQLEGMSNQQLVQMGLKWFAKPTMKGYVRDYTNLLGHHKYAEDDVKRYAEQVMQSYTPDQLPVLNGLAEHYAVCDMWFSSVPSQTNPNRAFAFCGTSMGLVDNGFLEEDPRRVAIEDFVGYKIGDDRFKAKTIFNALADDGKTTWMVYRQSGYLQNNILKAVDAIKRVLPDNTTLDYLKELSSSEVVSDCTHRLFPDQRNALIDAIIKHTGSFWPETQLKGMSNQELVQKGLEWFNSPLLRFGDKVFIQNKHFAGERLAPDSWFNDYLTTNNGDAYWTVVPILDEIPGPDSINTNNPYYLKHANSGRYVAQGTSDMVAHVG
jgi:hypothetical protein